MTSPTHCSLQHLPCVDSTSNHPVGSSAGPSIRCTMPAWYHQPQFVDTGVHGRQPPLAAAPSISLLFVPPCRHRVPLRNTHNAGMHGHTLKDTPLEPYRWWCGEVHSGDGW
jgi:hypothetical protein